VIGAILAPEERIDQDGRTWHVVGVGRVIVFSSSSDVTTSTTCLDDVIDRRCSDDGYHEAVAEYVLEMRDAFRSFFPSGPGKWSPRPYFAGLRSRWTMIAPSIRAAAWRRGLRGCSRVKER
jgi:hypothetical protein